MKPFYDDADGFSRQFGNAVLAEDHKNSPIDLDSGWKPNQAASLRRTRSRLAGCSQSLKGAPLRRAPGLRARHRHLCQGSYDGSRPADVQEEKNVR
jgi:hypothetical protein